MKTEFKTIQYPSERDPATQYIVNFFRDENCATSITCTCPSYKFSTIRTCKHCQLASAQLAADEHAGAAISLIKSLAAQLQSMEIEVGNFDDAITLWALAGHFEKIINGIKNFKEIEPMPEQKKIQCYVPDWTKDSIPISRTKEYRASYAKMYYQNQKMKAKQHVEIKDIFAE